MEFGGSITGSVNVSSPPPTEVGDGIDAGIKPVLSDKIMNYDKNNEKVSPSKSDNTKKLQYEKNEKIETEKTQNENKVIDESDRKKSDTGDGINEIKTEQINEIIPKNENEKINTNKLENEQIIDKNIKETKDDDIIKGSSKQSDKSVNEKKGEEINIHITKGNIKDATINKGIDDSDSSITNGAEPSFQEKKDDKKAVPEVDKAFILNEEDQKGAATSIQSFIKGKNEIEKPESIVDIKRSDMKDNQGELKTNDNYSGIIDNDSNDGKNNIEQEISKAFKLKEEEQKGAATSIQSFLKGKNEIKKAKEEVAVKKALKVQQEEQKGAATSIQLFLKGKNEIKKAKEEVAIKIKDKEERGAATSIQSFFKGKNEIKKSKNIVDLKRLHMKENQENLNDYNDGGNNDSNDNNDIENNDTNDSKSDPNNDNDGNNDTMNNNKDTTNNTNDTDKNLKKFQTVREFILGEESNVKNDKDVRTDQVMKDYDTTVDSILSNDVDNGHIHVNTIINDDNNCDRSIKLEGGKEVQKNHGDK